MGAVHAARQCAMLGMHRVLIPAAAPAFSALGLLTADHVIDDTRSLVRESREVDVDLLTSLADALHGTAAAKLPARRSSARRGAVMNGGSISSIPVRHSTSRFPFTSRAAHG